ncbi:DUF1579 domain-containing protein [Planctomicrobium sp. SH668]|uniref:DUF1579 domain-containing protein n=1 Tax=Planctomicrobium sp. SH668 TaxID=3448126 RepID=UPI003F5B46F9
MNEEVVVTPQHQWLKQLIGDWSMNIECVTGPGEPKMVLKSTDSVRGLGDLWVLCEGNGETPMGGTARSVMTIGFDPDKNQFVGSFVASVMPMIWHYLGSLDEKHQTLTLNSEGPNFEMTGRTQYRDIIRIVDENHRTMTSECLMADGTWVQFMQAEYTRI